MSNVKSKSSNTKCQMYFAKSVGLVRSQYIYCDGFCDKDEHEQQEWGILVVRFCRLEKEQKNWNEV